MISSELILKRMGNQKINYDNVLRQMIKKWQQQETTPRILMHSCCAPCSTYTLEFLCQYAEVSIYFANSNIHPKSEYERRALVQKQFVEDFNKKTNQNVLFIEAPYEPQHFIKEVINKNLQDEDEGGKRCDTCFEMRLDLVAKEALKLGYDYFGSALTISPKKNAQQINTIGLEVQQLYDVNYLPSDFKKQGGTMRSIEMCEEYNIYRQCYCGCVFAAEKQGIDLKKVSQEAKNFKMGLQ
ncbi:MAG: epoxyqueuosine reductase QueH [Erysipelothrix sp.]|nr:epoxyqueuosine reductase QueH [Erysipelothrix sp.]